MSFTVHAALSVLATLLTLVACSLGIWGVVGSQAVPSAIAAGCVSIPIGIAMLLMFYFFGTGASVLVLGSFLRVSLTLGVGFLVARLFDFWNQPYFVTLGALYLANLASETGLVYWQTFREPKKNISSTKTSS